jgi:hypothetical protein
VYPSPLLSHQCSIIPMEVLSIPAIFPSGNHRSYFPFPTPADRMTTPVTLTLPPGSPMAKNISRRTTFRCIDCKDIYYQVILSPPSLPLSSPLSLTMGNSTGNGTRMDLGAVSASTSDSQPDSRPTRLISPISNFSLAALIARVYPGPRGVTRTLRHRDCPPNPSLPKRPGFFSRSTRRLGPCSSFSAVGTCVSSLCLSFSLSVFRSQMSKLESIAPSLGSTR